MRELSEITGQIVGSTQLARRFAIVQIGFAPVCIYDAALEAPGAGCRCALGVWQPLPDLPARL
jgi:hypothetical protein